MRGSLEVPGRFLDRQGERNAVDRWRLVMDLINASAVVPTSVRGRVTKPDELCKKLPSLLTFDDAREGRVLTEQADSGVEHHGHQEASLAFGEAELCDGLNAFVEPHQ